MSTVKKSKIREKIKNYFSKPFLVWEITPQRKWLLFILIMLFSVVFKLVYHPFGIKLDKGLIFFLHHGAISATVLFFQLFFLPKIFAGYFHESVRTLSRQILWTVVLFTLLIVFHGIYNKIFSPFYISIYDVLINSAWVNLGIGVYPIMVIFLLAYIRQLTEKPPPYHSGKAVPISVPESLIDGIPIHSIGYIKSLDNYSEIHYLKGKKVVRKSLNSLEKELKEHEFIRTHRSYIVNQFYIKSIEGNANKSSLVLRKFDHLVPISRRKRPDVLKTLQKQD